jgi:choline dehydrogenase
MNRWAKLVDDDSYTFQNVLPFYQRTPTFHPPDNALRPSNASVDYNPDAFLDSGEPLQVSYPIDNIVFSTWMARGMQAIGIPEVQDFNSGRLLGAQWCPFTVRPEDRTRSSSEAAFRGRPNNDELLATMRLYRKTMGKRVLFGESIPPRATGVEVRTGRQVYVLHATREVIISAGAFQSPQLLMVSGIGPAETLRLFQIPLIVDLPGVGQNMWDHLLFGPSYRVSIPTNSRIPRDLVFTAEQGIQYLAKRRGLFTNPGADYLAWEKIPDSLRAQFSQGTRANLSWFPPSWPEAEVRDSHLPLLFDPLSLPPPALICSPWLRLANRNQVHLLRHLPWLTPRPLPRPTSRRLYVRFDDRLPRRADLTRLRNPPLK